MIETSPNWFSRKEKGPTQTSCTAGPGDQTAVVRTHTLPLAALLSSVVHPHAALSARGPGHSGHGSERLSNPAGGSTLPSPQHLQSWGSHSFALTGPAWVPCPPGRITSAGACPCPQPGAASAPPKPHGREGAGGTRRKAQKVFRGGWGG